MTTDANHRPPRERLFPQLSLLFLLKLTAACAVIMGVLQASFSQSTFWATLLSVVLVTAASCFALYAAMFCIASAIAGLSGAIIEPFKPHEPISTEVGPAEVGPAELRPAEAEKNE